MSKTILDNLEEHIFSKVNNEEELKILLNKVGIDQFKIKNALAYYTIYNQKENWLLTKMLKDNEVLKLKNINNIDECINTIDIIFKNQTFNKALIYLDNKDYKDIDKLNKLHIPFYIVTNQTLYNIEEFKGMRQTINYYKSLVKDLSPLEQVTYIYDLIKSFEYKESNNKEESRYIKHIIETGNIVCVGYTKFICQILSELGFKCFPVSLENKNNEGHERFLIKINDEKYNINNVFAMDATFDSAKDISLCIDKNNKKVLRNNDNPVKDSDKVIKKYDNLILYRNFLIPLIEYGLKFSNEKINEIKEYSSNKTIGDTDYYQQLQTKHTNNRSIDLKLFIKLMYNVKLSEGYSINDIASLINDIIEVNNFSKENQIELINQLINEINSNYKK